MNGIGMMALCCNQKEEDTENKLKEGLLSTMTWYAISLPPSSEYTTEKMTDFPSVNQP